MTFWDVVFGIGGRDEELWVTMLRWVGQIMLNFTVGLVSALFSFAISLVYMLWEYKVSYLSGLVFFLVAMSGACSTRRWRDLSPCTRCRRHSRLGCRVTLLACVWTHRRRVRYGGHLHRRHVHGRGRRGLHSHQVQPSGAIGRIARSTRRKHCISAAAAVSPAASL